jgi:heptaprenyl diphosphate synthase
MRIPTDETPVEDSHSSKIDLVVFLAALSLFLSTIEYVIPKPIPFLRIGLANLPLLISLHLLPLPYLILLILMKVVGQALIQGTLFSYVFLLSLTGSTIGGLFMILASRIFGRYISLLGISVLGALGNNTSQIAVAVLLVFGANGWLIAPPVIGVGVITSALLGLFAQRFVERSLWVRQVQAAI